MTRLTYDICLNNRVVKNVTTYQEAKTAVAELNKVGRGWTYRPRYTYFDPKETPEMREKMREQAHKVQEKMAQADA